MYLLAPVVPDSMTCHGGHVHLKIRHICNAVTCTHMTRYFQGFLANYTKQLNTVDVRMIYVSTK